MDRNIECGFAPRASSCEYDAAGHDYAVSCRLVFYNYCDLLMSRPRVDTRLGDPHGLIWSSNTAALWTGATIELGRPNPVTQNGPSRAKRSVCAAQRRSKETRSVPPKETRSPALEPGRKCDCLLRYVNALVISLQNSIAATCWSSSSDQRVDKPEKMS